MPYGLRRTPKRPQKPEFFVKANVSTNVFEPNFRLKRVSDYSSNYRIYNAVYSFRADESSMDVVPISDVVEENLSYQQASPSFSYSAGVNYGVLLFNHWTLQTGIYYHDFRTVSNTNLTVSDIDGVQEYPLAINTVPERIVRIPTINSVNNYTLENRFSLISVPFETGVQFQHRKRTIILKAGVSADFFLQNTITDAQGNLDVFSVKTGDSENPYRAMSFSGLFGAEVSLFSTKQYGVFLEGMYRTPFGSNTHDEASFTSQPESVTFGLNFRYFLERKF